MTAGNAVTGEIDAVPGAFGSAPGQTLIKVEFGTLIWSEPLQGGGRAVMKMYRQRPFYEPARRLLVSYRAEREYRVLSHLVRHGIPCSEPLSWSRGRHRLHGRYELLATREIAGAVALDVLLQQPGAVTDLAPLFRLARCLHDSGVSHGAFVPRNIVVSFPVQGVPTFHVIDMAYSRAFPGGIAETRMAAYDLLDLLFQIQRHFPPARCRAWLADYGLGESAAHRLMARLARHRPGRPWRHLRRAETHLRSAMACLRAPRSPTGGDSQLPGPPAASRTSGRSRS